MIDDLPWFVLNSYCALVAWTFVVAFVAHPARRRTWGKSATGVNLVGLMTSLAAAFTLIALGDVIYVSREVWIIVITLIAAFLTHRLAMLLHKQRRG